MNIGDVCIYRKKRLVYITDGAEYVDGRLSNFWNFRYINPDGTLSRKGDGNYDNGSFVHVSPRSALPKVHVDIIKKSLLKYTK